MTLGSSPVFVNHYTVVVRRGKPGESGVRSCVKLPEGEPPSNALPAPAAEDECQNNPLPGVVGLAALMSVRRSPNYRLQQQSSNPLPEFFEFTPAAGARFLQALSVRPWKARKAK